jgi:hypothetical protein
MNPEDCAERVRELSTQLRQFQDQHDTLTDQASTVRQAPTLAEPAEIQDLIHRTLGPALKNKEAAPLRKATLRLLLQEIRVHNKKKILPTFRVPHGDAVRVVEHQVEVRGLEPTG